MDSCESVEKEIDKVIKKFTDVKDNSVETINEIISVISVLLNSLGKSKHKDVSHPNQFWKLFDVN